MTRDFKLLWGMAAAVVMAGSAVVASPAPADSADDQVVHVLNRLGYGPRPGDVARVTAMGVDAYIEQQLHPERVDDSALQQRLAAFPTLTLSSAEINRDYFAPAEAERQAQRQAAAREGMTPTPPAPPTPSAPQSSARQREQQILQDLMQAKVVRAVASERQLEEVLTDFWFNHFNVFSGKGQVRAYLTSYERDVIRPHVLGNFRDMLGAVAESPAMLFYLDNFQNVDPKASQRQAEQLEAQRNRPVARARQRQMTDEQREQQDQRLMTLRNRGLNENYARELMELHTLGVDGGYTQADVVAVARAFTGWTIDRPRDGGSFQFNGQVHDNDPKVVLGTTIKAGGKKDGEAVLDLLSTHPATAKFIATKLARRFIADEPPAALVDRVAKVFLDTKGDLRAVTRAVITSPEFFSTEYRRAKVKTPLEFVVSAVRATGATLVTPASLVQALRDLGMPLYGAQPPTGYGDTAEDWINTGALLKRLNFAIALAGAQGQGRGQGQGQLRGVRLTIRGMAPDTSEATRMKLIDTLIGTEVSTMTSTTLAKAGSPQHLVALTLGSPEFQRR